MNDKLYFATDLYRGTAEYYDRYRLPYPEAMTADLTTRTRAAVSPVTNLHGPAAPRRRPGRCRPAGRQPWRQDHPGPGREAPAQVAVGHRSHDRPHGQPEVA